MGVKLSLLKEENDLSQRIGYCGRKKQQWNGENCITIIFTIFSDQMKMNEMDEACGRNGRYEDCI
jgi:hypothetical protein